MQLLHRYPQVPLLLLTNELFEKQSARAEGCIARYGLFCVIGKCVPITQKMLREDAHSREKNYVAMATVLGARVSQAKLFIGSRMYIQKENDTITVSFSFIKGNEINLV